MRERIEAEGHSKWSVEWGTSRCTTERVSDLLAKREEGLEGGVCLWMCASTRRVACSSRGRSCAGGVESGRGPGAHRGRQPRAPTPPRRKMNDRTAAATQSSCCCCAEERSMQTATGQTITTAGKKQPDEPCGPGGVGACRAVRGCWAAVQRGAAHQPFADDAGRVIDMLADNDKEQG
ncbi:hypothetical protein TcBrA4_0075770 [Trypanosoma cruzi]|nr:hypothetical protein TcBrA4_0075770 [Trypanosoma cruzi]